MKLLKSLVKSATRASALAAALVLCGVQPAVSAVPEGAVEYSSSGSATTLANGDLVITFGTGDGTLKVNGPALARILLVGGGGAGGKGNTATTGSGGGGGAGGFHDTLTASLLLPGDYGITVGAGAPAVTAVAAGLAGEGSSVTGPSVALSVLGGGGGGGASNAPTSGGSGGGASKSATGAAGTENQGNAGGSCASYNGAAAGGGGAGANGADASGTRISGNGGAGKASDITGTSVTYAGGGGGAARQGDPSTAGLGGLGGGGDGAYTNTMTAAWAMASAGTDGLGGGGGGGNNISSSGKGGDGVVIIRISAALKGLPEKPVSTNFYFDGAVHAVMPAADFAYTIDGTASASALGDYRFTVTPVDGVTWSDGTTDPVTVDWSIVKMPVDKPVPESFVYDGTVKTAIERRDDAYTVDGVIVAQTAAVYQVTLTLKDGFAWSDGDTAADYGFTWEIARAPNEITGLSIVGWTSGNTPHLPTATAKFGQSELEFFVRPVGTTEWIPATVENLTALAAADYDLKAVVEETDNYLRAETGDTDCQFSVVGGPGETFHNSITLKLDGYRGSETLTDFPVLVKLNETDLYWFTYGAAQRDGFRFADRDGNFLPHDVDVWNERGDSYVWVRVPELPPAGTEITLCWSVKAGRTIPKNNPAEVWSRYLLVLHGEGELANAAGIDADLRLPSDTSHGQTFLFDPSTGDSFEGRLGAGFNKPDRGAYGIEFKNLSSRMDNPLRFTVSGWFNHISASDQNLLFCAATNIQAFGGGALLYIEDAYKQLQLCINENKRVSFTTVNPTPNEWHYHALSYNGMETPTVILATDNRSQRTSGSNYLYRDLQLPNWAFGQFAGKYATSSRGYSGMLDELRIFNGAASADWLLAEYEQLGGEPFYSIDRTKVDGVYMNAWLREPTLPLAYWHAGEAGFEVADVDPGEALFGSVEMTFYRHDPTAGLVPLAPEELMPTEVGVYEVVFSVPAGVTAEGRSYQALQGRSLKFAIIEPAPYYDGFEVREGRILLAGNVKNPLPVEQQAYYQTASDCPAFWVHEGAATERDGNLLPYEEHTYYTRDYGEKLWYLHDIRIGNTLPATGSGTEGLYANQVYLPWSEPVLKNSKSSLAPDEVGRSEVAHMVMRNCEEAAIYSSCFTNGIGTIYFDAANAWTNTWTTDVGPDDRLGTADDVITPNCVIAVYIATNCVGSAKVPPTDLNCIEVSGGETNLYGRADWQPVEMVVLKRDYPADATGERPFVRVAWEEGVTNEILDASCGKVNLSIANGGTVGNFYRICVPLNYDGPIRFKIVRESAYARSYGSDRSGQILLDNLIVSRQRMRVDLLTYPQVGDDRWGYDDPAKKGKQILGYEAAWEIPFPSVTDEAVMARAKPVYFVNGDREVDVSTFVVSSILNYRWRYLDQTTNRLDDVYGWQQVQLDPANGFRAMAPLNLPGLVGDVEFYYTTYLNAPFYGYVDYTGLDLGLSGLYTEEVSCVTNRADASAGRDWFVRLREGKSDYESVRLVTRVVGRDGTETTQAVEMEVFEDHVWRGYLKTADPVDELGYHFEAFNRQTPGDVAWQTNSVCWRNLGDSKSLPVHGSLVDCGFDEWATLPSDAQTGYLLFQIDEETRALSVVHADYQNFNGWNDAKKADGMFVGTSTEDSSISKSGVSPLAMTAVEEFTGWKTIPETRSKWEESFLSGVTRDYDDYVTFPAAETPQLWSVGQGMWVYGLYRDPDTGHALQMEGCGRGFIQYVNGADTPHGLKSVKFTARLAQTMSFDDFAYYDAVDKKALVDYTIAARGAFDFNSSKDFCGNATLSLVSRYRPNVGCYELRLEQTLAPDWDSQGWGGQTMSIIRWQRNRTNGRMTSTVLASVQRTVDNRWLRPTKNQDGPYVPLFLSVRNEGDGSVSLRAGYAQHEDSGRSVPGMYLADADSRYGESKWLCLEVRDPAIYTDGTKNELTYGTYGLGIANCPGALYRPVVFPALPYDESKDGKSWEVGAGQLAFGTAQSCFPAMQNGEWVYLYARNAVVTDSANLYGLRALVPEQTLSVYTAPAGTSSWPKTPVAIVHVDTFAAAVTNSVDIYSTDDNSSVRIAVDGSLEDVRTDVVVDDLSLSQWAGYNWEEFSDPEIRPPNWRSDKDLDGHTNFVVSSAWTYAGPTNGCVLLSAKRTPSGMPSSVRSPLFDGETAEDGSWKRGVGLGMFAFNYTNAQANARLLVQIATNVNESTVTIIDRIDDDKWITVQTNDFSRLSAEERRSGTRTCYIGLHGVHGVARVVVDPALIDEVAGVTDPDLFGEIFITKVICRDEPNLDSDSWWGWNLRTVGSTDGHDVENRMFLSDLDTDPEGIGLSLALNNTTTENIAKEDQATYREHQPFVQTPTFRADTVGEVAFRARTYDSETTARGGQPSEVALYGSRDGSENGQWNLLARFVVSNDTYASYSYKTLPGDAYAAFRLAVTGVSGVRDTHVDRDPKPLSGGGSMRVLIDEIVVSEAVRARMAFRNVGAIRGCPPSSLASSTILPDVPSEREQPLCNEGWGVQCEIYPAQLGDEIDFTREPRVRLHWYEGGDANWGFEHWGALSEAEGHKSAWLAPATDSTESNRVYRSSYTTCPEAVIPMSKTSGTVVPYMLEVVFYQKPDPKSGSSGASRPMTNYLAATDWDNPAWYAPVDLNRDRGGNRDFSAYTILDTVAPHWAWINEMNLFGEETWEGNSDANCQFVEIAVPAEADISNWIVRYIEGQSGVGTGGSVATNVLGVFGSGGLESTKPNGIGASDNMVFRVLACEDAMKSQRLKFSDGTLDGTWKSEGTTALMFPNGELSYIDPISIQLVRSSGIVEHEVTFMGTNIWYAYGQAYVDEYHPTNACAFINEKTGTHFFYVGSDDCPDPANSVGVFTSRGESPETWNNTMTMTPGRKNQNQEIDPDHPTPNGDSILINCYVDTEGGHIVQSVGGFVETNGYVQVVIQKGSGRGTNITYRVDPWYQLDTVNVTTGKYTFAAPSVETSRRVFEVTVGKGCSNNVTVTAAARPNDQLLEYGIDDSNPYKPAVMDWLGKHQDAYGNDWADCDSDEARLADLVSYSTGAVITNLTLTQMYWLDMDPTVGNLAVVAGIAEAAQPLPVETVPGAGVSQTNVRMGVYMMITNRTEDVSDTNHYGKAWAPYILRGIEPGVTSWDYAKDDAKWGWSSVTFKVQGVLMNGQTSAAYGSRNWVPLRWFVFEPDSFPQAGEPDAFISRIEIKDPFNTESPAYSDGWYRWVSEHGYAPVGWSWSIDTSLKPFNVELLKKYNYYRYDEE